MSERGRKPDLSPTQLVSGGLATATATVATSYLGVGGTLIGAAFMSVVTTAGAAVYQHYLDRGKRRYVPRVTTEIGHRVVGHTAASAESTEASGEPAEAGKPAESTRAESAPARPSEAESTRLAEPAGPDETAELKESAAAPAPDGGGDARAQARRPRWYVLAGAAFAIFAVVIGAITAVESLANKPVSAMLGRSDRSGTSLGETFSDGGPAPTRHPVVPSSTAPASPSDAGTATPSGGSSEPATAPVPPPESPSAPATTRPPAPTPTTPSTRLPAP
jgi:hypothetical protein